MGRLPLGYLMATLVVLAVLLASPLAEILYAAGVGGGPWP